MHFSYIHRESEKRANLFTTNSGVSWAIFTISVLVET